MNESIAIAAIIVASMALLFGVAGFVLALAMKMSTHQVTWRSLDDNKADPFEEEMPNFEADAPLGENPNKRIKEENEEDEDLVDLSDPSETSNKW